MVKTSIFAAACLLMTIPAFAQDEPKVDCDNALNQVEMNFCAHKEWEAADAELNKAYSEAKKSLTAQDADLGPDEVKAADRLLDAQRSWLTYRDAHCEVQSFVARSGSMQPMLYSMCLAEVTVNRTKELKALVSEN
jgi:uncharacterized protein YecT (DUF1311 family)